MVETFLEVVTFGLSEKWSMLFPRSGTHGLDFVGASEGIEAYIVWCTTSDVLGAAMKPTTNALHATTVPLDLQTVLRPPMDAAAMFHLTRRGCRIILQNCTLGFTRGNAVAEKSRPMSRVFDVLMSGPYFTTLRSHRRGAPLGATEDARPPTRWPHPTATDPERGP